MINKRLFAILVCAVFLAGIAITTGVVFVVDTHRVHFTNAAFYIQNRAEVREQLEDALHPYVHNANILFSINRAHIIQVIESSEPRVRVTNIEVEFPNRLNITIRERYPQFVYRADGRVIILDSHLRIVADHELDKHIIDISYQINVPVANASIGSYLFDYLPEPECGVTAHEVAQNRMRMQRIVDTARFFEARENREDAMNHLFSSIEFSNMRGGVTDVRLNVRNNAGLLDYSAPRNVIIMYGVEDQQRFFQMTYSVWTALEMTLSPGTYRAFFTPTGNLRVSKPVNPDLVNPNIA